MDFIKKQANRSPIADNIFCVVRRAKEAKATYGKDQVIDATIGSLYDEEGNLVAYDTVFDIFDAIPKETKARYAGSFKGNDAFVKQIYEWVRQGSPLDMPHNVIATPGGTGAISMVLDNCMDEGQAVAIPEINWESYELIVKEDLLDCRTYAMFDGDHFNVDSFCQVCGKIMEEQNKLLVIVNDPCHNPTGYSMTDQEWDAVMAFLRECAKKGPVILVNDVAYMDYAADPVQARKYLHHFNNLPENLLVVIAFSCSKTMTAYGMRCGAALTLGKTQEQVNAVASIFEKTARSTWSNVNNAAMETFSKLTTDRKADFLAEKEKFIELLQTRGRTFQKEAEECGLPIYPFKEGFFLTVAVPDEYVERYHQALMDNNIFAVQVAHGIRVAICSLSVKQCTGLAKRMKDIYDQCVNG